MKTKQGQITKALNNIIYAYRLLDRIENEGGIDDIEIDKCIDRLVNIEVVLNKILFKLNKKQ